VRLLERVRTSKVVGIPLLKDNAALRANDVTPDDYIFAWSDYIVIVKEASGARKEDRPQVRILSTGTVS